MSDILTWMSDILTWISGILTWSLDVLPWIENGAVKILIKKLWYENKKN